MSKLENALNQIVGAVAEKVASKISAAGNKSKTKEKTKPNGVSGTKKRDMRCKGVLGNGQRCRTRSKGPRFQYLCEEHLGHPVKLRKKHKPKKSAAEPDIAPSTGPGSEHVEAVEGDL